MFVVSANSGGISQNITNLSLLETPRTVAILSDSSISTDSDSENEAETPRATRTVPLWSDRRVTQRIYKFTLFARVEEGSVLPFTFVFYRRPSVPSGVYCKQFPSNPFAPSLADRRISNSFRTSEHRNVKVLITKGFHKGKHGVIVKSYVLRKNSHRVLTPDGSVKTYKQIHLRRLDAAFWLPYGFPVEANELN